ncbi:MAG: ABC transporter transmembrane domain-containing protein [Verrucomicrobiota bacterium]
MKSNKKNLLRRFAAYYRRHRLLFTIDMITAALHAGFTVMIPFLVVRMLNRETLAESALAEIWITIGMLSALILLMAVTQYINTKWGHILGARIETDMRSDLFRHLQKLSFRYFDNTKTGHIMSRISSR